MHKCVKKLLGNMNNPEKEEIKSLCKLLTVVGNSLDTQKAWAHMNVFLLDERADKKYSCDTLYAIHASGLCIASQKWTANCI